MSTENREPHPAKLKRAIITFELRKETLARLRRIAKEKHRTLNSVIVHAVLVHMASIAAVRARENEQR